MSSLRIVKYHSHFLINLYAIFSVKDRINGQLPFFFLWDFIVYFSWTMVIIILRNCIEIPLGSKKIMSFLVYDIKFLGFWLSLLYNDKSHKTVNFKDQIIFVEWFVSFSEYFICHNKYNIGMALKQLFSIFDFEKF